MINYLVEEGIGVILISSEIDEILNMTDRLILLKQGEIRKTYVTNKVSKENIYSQLQ